MKQLVFLSLVATLFAGCCAYTEIGRIETPVRTDDGETPIAAVNIFNVSYSLFGLIPLESGTTWKTGPYEDRDRWNAGFFRNRCTLDENLASLRAALKVVGSSRTANLVTESDSWRFWSFFLIKREIIKTSCLIIK